ncbi:MAG: hypothetical protein SFY92_00660 [Verrucomicrobiae bacterium]|nr:hypothetical protein [Verrucomicrobiae bacterium]
MTAAKWFAGARDRFFEEIEKLKGKKQKEAMKEFLETDKKMLQDRPKTSVEKKAQAFAFKVNEGIEADIAGFRKRHPELDKQLKSADRDELENRYILNVMRKEKYQPDLNANIAQDVANFREDNPSLNERAKTMTRERLENALALGEMKKHGYDPQLIAMRRFYNRPENAKYLTELLQSVEHLTDPKFAERVMWKEKAPKIIKKHGLKLS